MNGRHVELFMIVATGEADRQLRRYSSGNDESKKCPGSYGYHNGHSPFGRTDVVYADPERKTIKGYVEPDEMPPHDDPRWPQKCDECDYAFQESDEWQVFIEQIYRRIDTDEECTLRDAPLGAMWDCPWFSTKGPDGTCICIMTPGGAWMPDLPSTSGTPWQRTGTLPKITCNPSILIPGRGGRPEFHAWLRAGVLIDC